MDVEAESQASNPFSLTEEGEIGGEMNNQPTRCLFLSPARIIQLRRIKKCTYPWFLCTLSFIVQFLVLGFFKGFGSVYISLQAEFNESDALTAWVGSISFALTYMLTPLTFKICNRYGFRIPMFIGGLLYGLGLFTSSFVPNIPTLYVTLGLIFAVGESLCFSASLLILPLYFKKNWSLAHGIALSGNSTGALAISPALGYLLSRFGFKSGFKILSSASIVLIVISVFYKRPDPEQSEDAPNTDGSQNDGGVEGEAETAKEALDTINEGPSIPLRKNKAFVTFITGTTLMHFGYYIPFVHLVRMAVDLGIPKTEAMLIPGYMSLAQTFGKLILGKLATMPRTDKIVMYQFALIANCLATTLCPIITTNEGLIIYAVVFGLADGCTSANNMLVVGDLVSRKQLSTGYSVFLVTSAASFLIGPPVAGLLYDLTGAYDLAFFFSGGTAALAACVMFLVPIFKIKEGLEKPLHLLAPTDDGCDDLEAGKTEEEQKKNKRRSDFQSDSGIITDTTPQSSKSQSNESLHIAPSSTAGKANETYAVWTDDLHIKMMPSAAIAKQRKEQRDEKMLFCSSSHFPLVLDEKELDELLKKESNHVIIENSNQIWRMQTLGHVVVEQSEAQCSAVNNHSRTNGCGKCPLRLRAGPSFTTPVLSYE
eukprot:gene16678-18370_t